MANPKLAYTNFFETGIVTASSEAIGFEKQNAYDGLTYDGWKPSTPGIHYLTVSNASGQSADYWTVFAHDLHINGATIYLQYSSDNFSADINDVGIGISPSDSRVIFREFSPITSDYWRIKVISYAEASVIGVAMIGSALELESTLPVDASNFISYARDNMYINNQSNAGTLLGKSLIRKGLDGRINFRFMTPSWFRSNWETFMDHAEKKPFVFVADATNYPDEAIYAYLDGKQTDPRPTNAKYMNFSINVRGFLYGDSSLFNVWDISTAIYSGSPEKKFSVSGQDILPRDLSIKPDGLTMFVYGDANNLIYQYTLGTAWEVNTASYASKNSGVISEDTFPSGFFVRPDGTSVYIIGITNDAVYQYTLGTPWDISTISYASKSMSILSETTTARGISISPDGTKVLIGDASNERVHQYTLSTAWDIGTGSYDTKFFSSSGVGAGLVDIFTRQNGSQVFVLTSSNDRVSQYELSQSWIADTASYTLKNFTVTQDTSPRGIFIKPDGLSLYISGDTNNTIYQYDMG